MAQYSVEQVMQASPIMPVIVIDRLQDAVPLAKALLAGGINVLEVTLRTEVALQAVEVIAAEVEDAIVGVGTVSNAGQLQHAMKAGAQFAISPGVTPSLLSAASEIDIPFLPGVATVSELMLGMEAGLRHFKFFPATAAGGIPVLKAFTGPYPEIKFCPTGGIGPNNYLDFLALPNVLCVGGSWVAAKAHVAEANWDEITRLAEQAVTGAKAS